MTTFTFTLTPDEAAFADARHAAGRIAALRAGATMAGSGRITRDQYGEYVSAVVEAPASEIDRLEWVYIDAFHAMEIK